MSDGENIKYTDHCLSWYVSGDFDWIFSGIYFQVYYDLYEKDKERYEEELKIFSAREKPAAPAPAAPAPTANLTAPTVPTDLIEQATGPVPIKSEAV